GNVLLGVYISDVSYYVTENSVIDQEALERGTSVYLVDRVIPMLPHKLSNGICSLNRGEDRLTLSCEMEITPKGQVENHKIYEAVLVKFPPIVDLFENMASLAAILRQKRMDRGAIDFDFKEAQVIVDKDGKAEDIVLRERSVGEKLIEEFMLATNETIAEH